MNCPSRTENDFLHPHWNQNPPLLSADLTPREDLNGRVNATQLRDASAGASSPAVPTGADEGPEKSLDAPPSSRPACPLADAKLLREYREGLCGRKFCSAKHQAPRLTSYLKTAASNGWPWWLSGVFMALYSIYYMGVILSTFEIKHRPAPTKMEKRQAVSCSTGGPKPNYNVGLHVGALGIILFVSFFACSFPMLTVRFPRLRIPHSFLFFVRHFGTGVLVATAFVHLLPTAFISLGNRCLSSFWTDRYPAIPGAIALAAVFLVMIVEMVFSPARHVCGSTKEVTRLVCNDNRDLSVSSADERPHVHSRVNEHHHHHHHGISANRTGHLEHDPLSGRSASMGRELARLSTSGDRPEITTSDEKTVPPHDSEKAAIHDETSPIVLTPEQKMQKAFMQCVMLEIGILFHSVFIGMALSVSVGNDFVVLLIAITFHQSFEGLALGARIASLPWNREAIQPWLMALAYGCTTPIGQAIGLATHQLYEPESEVGLIMVGTMNAISSGLLVFASLVELLSEDFLSDESWRTLRGKKRIIACVLVFAGAFGMSLVGAWA
ncbi:hypothetical protein LOZ58_000057 [Ophidiomyces ophidiicola]|nr:hypothetical protein LOZ66_002501 [Ophidiomyces ophidiicola]KAI1966569.1 hypothetical protein LOZ58_000057 [Ophidiomyces ophidiicola]